MKYFVAYCITALSICSIVAAPIVQLTPPPLHTSNLIKGFCDRPKRHKGIFIAAETGEQKKIFHCYGHGGSGFTTLFGSINKALQLIVNSNIATDEPIHIIGAGCMGLLLAVELYRHGFHNICISAKELYNLPSWRAGGFFDPGSGHEQAPEDLLVVELGLATYKVLQTIEQGGHAYLTSTIVHRVPLYCPKNVICEAEILAEKGLMPQPREVTIDFGNSVLHENFLEYYTYFIDVPELMKQLWQQITLFNIPVIQEEITSFAQCKESVICNCTGLGSGTLNNDPHVYSARGHFFMLSDTSMKPLDYMFFTKAEYGNKKEYIYFFPKNLFVTADQQQGISCCGMLGGTCINDVDKLPAEEQAALNEQEWERLLVRAQELFNGVGTTQKKLP